MPTLPVLLAGFIFWEPVADIVAAWGKEEYSHAWLVPPLALLLALHRLAEKPPAPKESGWGLALVGLGLGLHLAGRLSGMTVFPQYGFFIALLGVVWTVLGGTVFVRLLPVLAYLFFAIPLPTTLYIGLSAKLQLFSSALGTEALQLLGFTAYQEGNVIDLGVYRLQVVEACSGLRYIFPLLGFSYLVAYCFRDALWKRAVVFLSAIPLALLLNVLRIVLVGATVDLWGIGAAEGLLHDLEGWVVFSVCVLLLMGEALLLHRIGARGGGLDARVLSMPRGPFFASPPKTGGVFLALLVLFSCIAAGQAAGMLAPKDAVIPPRLPFAAFPAEIGGWRGTAHGLSAAERELLRLSDYLDRTYRHQNQTPVRIFIGYYETQRGSHKLHSPDMCIPGDGWEILVSSVARMKLAGGEEIPVNRALIRKGEKRQLVYYWFAQGGKNMARSLEVKGRSLVNALTTGRTDTALLRLTTPVLPDEEAAAVDARLAAFFGLLRPRLPAHLPDFMEKPE